LPWFERIQYAIRKTGKAFGHLKLNGKFYDIPLRSVSERLQAISFIKSKLKKNQPWTIESYVNEIEKRLRVPVAESVGIRFMNWEHVREMASAGMEIGSHTLSHPILSLLPDSQARVEIVGSKVRLEEELRQPVRSFCYPNGKRSDFSEITKKIVKEAGYTSASTTEVDYFDCKTDLYEIPRFYTSIYHPGTFYLNLLLGRN